MEKTQNQKRVDLRKIMVKQKEAHKQYFREREMINVLKKGECNR